MTIVTIHQPNYLPYVGLLDKVDQADVFVSFDTAQYAKNSFANRNRIRTAQGSTWLTIPIRSEDCYLRPIRDVLLPPDDRWKAKHWRSIVSHYGKARFFQTYRERLARIYSTPETRLAAWNERFLKFLFESFEIGTPMLRVGDLGVDPMLRSTDALVNIVRAVGGDAYLSGSSGRTYLDPAKFEAAGIELRFHEFVHPVHRQRFDGFVGNLAAIDLLLNEGPDAIEILRQGRTGRPR